LGEYVEYDDEPSRNDALERLSKTDVAILMGHQPEPLPPDIQRRIDEVVNRATA